MIINGISAYNSNNLNKPIYNNKFSGSSIQRDVSNGYYQFAKNYLALDAFLERTLLKPLLNSPYSIVNTTGKVLNTISTHLLKYDFQARVSVMKWGKIAIRPPIGAFSTVLYLGIIPSRLYAASLRPNIDKGEYLDILIRDLLGITAFVFLLDPARNNFAKFLGKSSGLVLTKPDGQAYGYSELVNLYRLNHPNRLIYITSERKNIRGIHTAFKQLEAHSIIRKLCSINPAFKKSLHQFRDSMFEMTNEMSRFGRQADQSTIFQKALKDPKIQDMAQKGYKMAISLERELHQQIYSPVTHIGKLGLKFNKLYQTPSVSRVFAQFACNKRVLIDVLGFTLTIAILGWGLTAFNEWYTNFRRGGQKIKER